MAVRAIRGATQVDADDRDQVLEATRELVSTVVERNGLDHDDIISIGELVVLLGAAVLLHAVCGSRLTARGARRPVQIEQHPDQPVPVT